MHLLIAAIGKASPKSPQAQLCAEYAKRLPWKWQLKELEIKKPLPAAQLKIAETTLLLEACAGAHKRVVLDEKGKLLTSREFADTLGCWQNQGASSIAFIIGGSDGLDGAQLNSADLALSFGRMTFPHLMVRAMLAEQLYRAYTLLHHHPYHRD